MNWLDTEHRYGPVSRALHWSMALLVLLMLGSDWWMEGLGEAAAMDLHQSIGLALLALLAFRLAWRAVNRGRLAERWPRRCKRPWVTPACCWRPPPPAARPTSWCAPRPTTR
ncbi:cytochrome b [Halomonas cerina]|uniref:Cytochrome b561 n=1 Tax=Halomonas cerina TaxID=447424 RepID=A0A839V6N6_9GAMM|nr:cytochrome b/b6 domain-containing protein [Halomonas cerina]MBB3189678.1 cytochrome b561 [Halomonas cerina]